ncbi:hypothetical protein L7F22_065274 [Adiantum nelumboides]|nr:hypothetical protein [Adiantum nelumboides]
MAASFLRQSILFITILSSPRYCLSLDNLKFVLSTFTSNDRNLTFSKESNVDQQAIQVTPNRAPISGSRDVSNSSGQTTHVNPLQLFWHNSSHNFSASFNTSFLLNIAPISNGGTASSGGGITFFLSSVPAIYRLPNSFGQWLGLFDGSAAKQEAQIVAIEFDTFKDSFEADGNHVAVDVNGSVHSIYAVSLSPQVSLTNTSTSSSGINTSVWIDYDGQLHSLDVYLANQGAAMMTKPERPFISRYSIDLRRYLPESVYVGFSASTGTILETHCVLQWNFTSTDVPSYGRRHKNNGIIIGCAIAGAAIGLLLIFLLVRFLVSRKGPPGFKVGPLGPQEFSYKVLKKATNGFSEECRLGKGSSGVVYKGVLRSEKGLQEIAVKCLSQESEQGEKDFLAEVKSLGRMRHKNLVQLLGWSYERSKLMLVYEYMHRGSLEAWIRQGQKGDEVMGWERRFCVMKGLAEGVRYLHEGGLDGMVTVHRDLKPSNILLDEEFLPKIGDFGLAMLIDMKQDSRHIPTTIAGTIGYIAPEYWAQGIVSKESDMYSLGVIAIELATGRRLLGDNDFLHHLAVLLENSKSQEAADPRLASFDPTQLELLIKLGLACCNREPSARLSSSNFVAILSSSSDTIAAPLRSCFANIYANAPCCLIGPHLDVSTSSQLVASDISTGR